MMQKKTSIPNKSETINTRKHVDTNTFSEAKRVVER